MVDVELGTNMHDADWLIFNGTVKRNGSSSTLRPKDVNVSIDVDDDAVHEAKDVDGTDRVFVRRGSTYNQIRPDPGFDLGSIPENSTRTSSACPNGSRCFGGVEYCCGSNVAMNNCYGRWRCSANDK
jgi:hypothetical protein